RGWMAFDDGVGVSPIQAVRRVPLLDKLLKSKAAKTAALMTAWNPGGQALSPRENAVPHRALLRMLRRLKLTFVEADIRDRTGAWLPERSVLVFGIDQPMATGLGKEFGQNEILFCRLGKTCQLVRCNRR